MKKLLTLSLITLTISGALIAEDKKPASQTASTGCETAMQQPAAPQPPTARTEKQRKKEVKEKKNKKAEPQNDNWLAGQMG